MKEKSLEPVDDKRECRQKQKIYEERAIRSESWVFVKNKLYQKCLITWKLLLSRFRSISFPDE